MRNRQTCDWDCFWKLFKVPSWSTRELGFNAFALMSDLYHRENFYSDVIKEILSPDGAHGESTRFLSLFIDFLADAARSVRKNVLAESLCKLNTAGSVQVLRESGRIDIKIKHEDWTVIIENKINGAGDRPRQIIGYYNKLHEQNENVVAVVYLKAADANGKPSDYREWAENERAAMDAVLVPIAGYLSSDACNLVDGWLNRCQLIARDFNVKSILAQFAELIIKQSGEYMDAQEVRATFESMNRHGVTYSSVRSYEEQLPTFVANEIRDYFAAHKTVFTRPWVWPGTKTIGVVSVLDDFIVIVNGVAYRFAIDIACVPQYRDGSLKNSITFFSREDNGGYDVEKLRLSDCGFRWNPDLARQEMLVDCDTLYGDLQSFCGQMEVFAQYLKENKDGLFVS